MSQNPNLDKKIDADGEQMNFPRNWDANPAAATMPPKRRQSILDKLQARPDILTIKLADQNCIHVEDNATKEVTVITTPGMADLYIERLDNVKNGGPI